MSNQVQCPNCRSYKVKVVDKAYRRTTGLILIMLGAIFLYGAFNDAPGLIIIGLPLALWGGYKMYLGFESDVAKGHCNQCNYDFEYKEF
jgi:hypothetical protein